MISLPHPADIMTTLAHIARNPATLALISSATFAAIGLITSVIARLGKSKRHAHDFVLIPALLSIVVVCTVFAYKENEIPAATGTAAQARLLEERVKQDNMFARCDAAAQPAMGAEATVNCQARKAGITASASSFMLTGQAIPFKWTGVSNQSQGLDAFLIANAPSLAPTPWWNLSDSSPGSFCLSIRSAPIYCNSSLKPGFSGYWGFPDGSGSYSVSGRLYCYAKSGTYYLTWTIDNDTYESARNEDIVVTAAGPSLASLISWWNGDSV